MKHLYYSTLVILAVSCLLLFSCDRKPPEPTVITFNVSALELVEGETAHLEVTITPARQAQNFSWSSSNILVATIDDRGNNATVNAHRAGTSAIRVTTPDGTRRSVQATVIPANSVYIDGRFWARSNVNEPGHFANNPEDAGMFFQWNRKIGWSATTPGLFEPIDEWDNFFTFVLSTSWDLENDPCPEGWRVPTGQEWRSLMSQNYFWTNHNGATGKMFGTWPNQIFIPAAGLRQLMDGALHGVGTNAFYWSRSRIAGDTPGVEMFAAAFWFRAPPILPNQEMNLNSMHQTAGLSIRCIHDN